MRSCETCKWNDISDYDCLNTNIVDCCEPKYEGWEPIEKTLAEKACPTAKVLKNPFDTQVGGSHYKRQGVMDVTEWCMSHDIDIGEFNVIKYVFRHENKNGIEDLRKAKHYLEMIAYVKYKDNL